jgi:hypothetical protein
MKRSFLFALSVAASMAPAALPAQTTPAEKEVHAVVEKFFTAFNAKDTTTMRTTMFGDVKLFTTGTSPQGQPFAKAEAGSDFLKIIASAPVKLYEKIFDPVIEIEDGLANVWTRYEFYADDKYSHCGIDSFLLVKTAEGWKIAALADTRRKECPKK